MFINKRKLMGKEGLFTFGKHKVVMGIAVLVTSGFIAVLAITAHAGGPNLDPACDTVLHDAGTPANAPRVTDIRGATVTPSPFFIPPDIPPRTFRVVSLKGEGDLKRAGEEDWQPLHEGDLVREGDELDTGYESRAVLMTSQGTALVVGEMTDTKVTTVDLEQGRIIDIHLDYGTLEVEVKKSGVKADLKIVEPNASVAIRGSLARVTHDDVRGNTTCLVADGTAKVETKHRMFTVKGPGDFRLAIKLVINKNGRLTKYRKVDVHSEEWTLLPNYLMLEMSVRGHIPVQSEAMPGELVSWHFVVDLDGDKATGLPGDKPPVSVFPDLGVDFWVEYGHEAGVGFYKRLRIFDTAGHVFELPSSILEVVFPRLLVGRAAIREAHDTLRMRVRLSVLQAYAALLAGIEVKPDLLKWVAVTNYYPTLEEDPPSDFFPNDLYVPVGGVIP